ncbi:MAG TPA: hypothetical protein VFI65_24880 [Streptosporangiaceae bacterium]|nr:hypothetical protein [Streptosporangiaceae bacterium]
MNHRYSGAGIAARAGLAVAAGAGLAAGVEVATYPLWRQWCRQWGATAAEASQALPGDDLLADPQTVTTRAITIHAPARLIWPWLVQLGPGRGGAYTYDWIENLLGLDMHSADRILPQYQDLKVGDAQHLGRNGPVLRVAVLEPEGALVLRSDDGNWIWAFALHPHGDDTRLISRNRIAGGASPMARAATTYLMEPGSLIMERKMLIGIKQRAEHLAGQAKISA